MKHFVCLIIALCLVAVQAFPDELIKLEPDTVLKVVAVEEAIPTEFFITEAPVLTPEPREVTKCTSSSGCVEDRTRLVNDLLQDYNKAVNPDHVTLKFGMTLMDFNVLECQNAIQSHVWFSEEWIDQRLTWNPAEYGGTESISIESGLVWKPDVTLYNSADPVNMLNCWETNVVIKSNGTVTLIPPCEITSICHLNLTKEPYGENTCSFKFGSWTYDGTQLDLQFQDDGQMDLSSLSSPSGSGFQIVGNSAKRNEKYYTCCEEPYPDLTFNLTFKRIPRVKLVKRL